MDQTRTTARPFGVALLGILVGVHGLIVLARGVAVFAVARPVVGPILSRLLGFAFVLDLLFGLILLYLAYSLWTLRPWARVTTLVIEGLTAFFALVRVVVNPAAVVAWVTLLLALVIIIYLLQPAVREAFTWRRS
jgi:hypothetical protein